MKFISLYLDRKATSWSLVLRRHWKNVGRETRKQVKERKSTREFANQANEPQCKWARSTRDSGWVQAHIQSQIQPLMPAARFHCLSQCIAWTSVAIFPHTHFSLNSFFFTAGFWYRGKNLHWRNLYLSQYQGKWNLKNALLKGTAVVAHIFGDQTSNILVTSLDYEQELQ